MIIGRFHEHADGTYIGTLRSLFLRADKILFEPIAPDAQAARGPDFRIYTSDEIEIGAAWSRMSKDGALYLDVTLDDPSFAQPVQTRLVQARKGTGFILIWERKAASQTRRARRSGA